ncbi:MAG: LbtU family siderophore porin [Gammaproteobacteria bacterium]|nr:LbtU family siderophore porin [Gammaproteobacteria bacterium]
MKKIFLMTSLLVLTPALAANATTAKTKKTQTRVSAKKHKKLMSEPRYIPEHQLPPHLQQQNLDAYANTNLTNTSAQAARDDKKSNFLNFGLLGDLDLKSQDTSNDFKKDGYTKVSVGVIEAAAHARLMDWVNLNVAGSYQQVPDTGSLTDYLKLEEAYATIGNFYKTPFYLSIGYQYLPFGVYTPYSISGDVTKQLDEAQNNMIGVGYEKRNFYGMVYFYGNQGFVNGQSHQVTPVAENWGVEAGFTHHAHRSGLHLNASYLNNYREVTIVSNLDPRNLDRVGAMSVHGDYFYGRFGALADVTFTTSAFNQAAMSYDGKGACPTAAFVQGYVRFHAGKFPSALGLGYGHSWQALALELPRYRFVVNYSLLLSKHFSAQLQYTHAQDYGTGDSANMNRNGNIIPATPTGKSGNAYEARLSFAFGSEKPDMYSELEE